MGQTARRENPSSEEFLAWESTQSDRHKFIDGEIYAMVDITRQHATVAGNVSVSLSNQLRGGPCRVYMADMKLRVTAFSTRTCSSAAPKAGMRNAKCRARKPATMDREA